MVMAPTYKKWTTGLDGIDKLKQGEAMVPSPKDGEVLVKILAVSLNYRDIEVCNGEYSHHASVRADADDNLVPCSDMCGVVVESRADRFDKGARVLSIFNQSHLSGQIHESDLATGLGLPLPGVLAQYRVFPADGLVAVPKHMTDEEASCLPIAGVTAWMSINGFRPIGDYLDASSASSKKDPAPTLLVQGTGGVSVSGMQIAQAAGMSTIVTSSSDDKLARAKKDLGAGTTVNYRTHWEWQGEVLEATGGRGADFILETGGQRTLRKSFECVAFGGTIACIGYLSGKGAEDEGQPGDALNVNVLALRRNVTLKGILNGPRDRFEEMLGFYEKKKIRPIVDKVFKFDDALDAFQYLHSGEHFGKVVIKVADK